MKRSFLSSASDERVPGVRLFYKEAMKQRRLPWLQQTWMMECLIEKLAILIACRHGGAEVELETELAGSL